MKYYLMKHRGGLNEALKTKIEITQELFNKLRKGKYNETIHYRPYCYDDRISCIKLIINNMEKHNEYPCWLLIEINEKIFRKFKKCNILKEIY